ncbi:type II toxin-antitoxin system VapC family toxin [Methylobacterium aerolatum]|uniref:PIN domain nuclease of toxin-antitoxin system n=1 Tax=Methylobacterium aerolatum TaxID=418708 RepID=A0ABU0HXJ7_9HYPH|nr:type II toxin-antitoxin system VapC family toxin [Methylobacterium aerolatum]MDQ0446204.1 PIN domain nuclease of toxin-antitoxin system [Methylobacterium aerolatum]
MLDASAVLAVIFDEVGADRVAAYIPGAGISAVNLAEVLAKLLDLGMPEATIVAILEDLQLAVISFDEAHAQKASRLRPVTRAVGLSLGDRACLATAALRGTAALSADRAWARLPREIGIEIELLR